MMNRIPTASKPEKMVIDEIETPPKIRIGSAGAEISVVKKIQAMKTLIHREAAKLKQRENEKSSKISEKENDGLSEEKKSSMEVETEASDDQVNDTSSPLQPPKEFQTEFLKQYCSFLDCCKDLDDSMHFRLPSICNFSEEQQSSKMKYLMKVYYLSGCHYYEANSLQIWDDIASILTEEEKAVIGNVKSFYQQNLFLFEKFSHSSQSVDDLAELLDLDIKRLTDPYILRPNGELNKDFYRDVLDHQSVLLKGFVDHFGISQTLFSVEHIAKTHPKDMIDVVFQNPYLYGFSQDTHATLQYKKQMSIQDYYDYQLESEAQEPQNVTDKNGMIKFAVNIDIEEWKKEMQELQSKLPKEFLFNTEHDAMSYSTQKIKGINLPQMYMKVEGAWTGGHEENLRLRAINLNHGPGNSVWFTVDVKHAKSYRKLVKEDYNLDIHKDEGLWFGDIDTCIKNGIEIQYFVQEPGDIVVLGPGCLHWVRCTGIATNSAWNFLSKDKFQFERGFERYDINTEIDFKSLIPLRHLAQKLLFKETFTIPKTLETFLIEKLPKFYDEEFAIFHDFKQKYPDTFFMYENDGNSVFNCVTCNHETLNFYVYCYGCSEKKPEDEAILICLKCYEAHKQECKKPNKTYFYFKMSLEVIKDLKEKLQNLEALKKDHTSLGDYVKKAIRADRELKYKEWQRSFNEDSPSRHALKTKPFDKKRYTKKPLHDIETIQEISREKTRQYALKEKTNKSLTKSRPRNSDEKDKSKGKHRLMKNSSASKETYEESRKNLKELEEKKLASLTHDPPSEDEEALQEDEDKNKYRIKKKTKLEEDGVGCKSNSNSIGFNQVGGGLPGNSSKVIGQDKIDNNPLLANKFFTADSPQSSGTHDLFFLGKLLDELPSKSKENAK